MDLYKFMRTGNKIDEEINLIHYSEGIMNFERIGNIYNLVDYINYSDIVNAKLEFDGFTGNQLDFIVKALTRYKSLVSIDEYNTLIISNKKEK